MSLDSMGPNKVGRSGVPGGRMTHSLSTPSGVDGTPPTITHHRGGKKLAIRVQMLDDSVTMFQVQGKEEVYKLELVKLRNMFLAIQFVLQTLLVPLVLA
ncbi:hypothetical protein DMENIID0001_136770 [Sergentomyia squamirostris]